jgi:two-component system alkaline phosphatase synthesis response regulator PhoP
MVSFGLIYFVMAYRILLAEDEASIRDLIALNLDLEGYTVQSVSNGKIALQKALNERFDLLILDVMMPDLDGFSVCEAVRIDNQEVPILFLTALNAANDRVKGLKLGADDYLNKPFHLEELLLRVKSLVQRGLDRKNKQVGLVQYAFGGNEINFSAYSALTWKGEILKLSQRETQLLKLLIERKGEVISRKQILEKVWGYDIFPSTRTIDNFILSFRKYFEKDFRNPRFFESIRGVGYRFIES